MGKLNIIAPLIKVDEARREVWGVIAAEELDRSGEIFDYASSVPLFRQWSEGFAKATDGKSLGNLRSMHSRIAAGKLIAIEFDDVAKQIPVGARVVDDAEWAKVQEGVYTGFSIGGDYANRWQDPQTRKMRYTAAPIEVSLVDAPCMPSAMFQVVKADGSTEMRKFAGSDDVVEETPAVEEPETVEQPASQGESGEETVAPNADLMKQFRDALEQMGAETTALLKRVSALEAARAEDDGEQPAQGDAEEQPNDDDELNKADGADLFQQEVHNMIDMESDADGEEPEPEDDEEDDDDLEMVEVSLLTLSIMHAQVVALGANCPMRYPERYRAEIVEENGYLPASPEQYVLDQLHDTLVGLGARCEHVEGAAKAAWAELAQAAGIEEEELTKAGRSISGRNMRQVQSIHDAAAALGAACGMGKGEQAGELAKRHEDEVADLKRQLGILQEQLAKAGDQASAFEAQSRLIADLKERVRSLEAQPEPGGPILNTEVL